MSGYVACVRHALWIGLAIVVAGCGGAGHPAHRAGPRCPSMLPGAHVGVVSNDPQLLTCSYASSGDRVRVTFDDGPQAWYRFDRALVERTQTTVEWAKTPAQQPKQVNHVGAGAFWVPATRELVASDGRRLLTVRVVRPARLAVARRLAVRMAPHGLGPPHVPVRTGP